MALAGAAARFAGPAGEHDRGPAEGEGGRRGAGWCSGWGGLRNVREPGIRFMIPLADKMMKVTLRTVTMPIPSQQVITQDNVSIGVAAVTCFRRVDPVKSILEIEDVSDLRPPDRPATAQPADPG